ncbi:MAG: PqqD family protein [Pseudomonadota bacterium]
MCEKKWTRSPDVVARKIGEDTILVPVGSSIVSSRCLFTLNDTGSFIWEHLAVPRTFSQISSALVEEFDVTRQKADKDLTRFLRELAEEGCVEEKSA